MFFVRQLFSVKTAVILQPAIERITCIQYLLQNIKLLLNCCVLPFRRVWVKIVRNVRCFNICLKALPREIWKSSNLYLREEQMCLLCAGRKMVRADRCQLTMSTGRSIKFIKPKAVHFKILSAKHSFHFRMNSLLNI
jgi:hypothetical protein